MVVNDDTGFQDARGGFESIASMLAPTGIFVASLMLWTTHNTVGARLLAMVVNDDTGFQDARGGFESIASMLAPTGIFAVGRFCVLLTTL
ncbi:MULTISPECIES: hypothetical protein [unclassified Pseudomonas]|uniref:hypothetical protein n=1 Tax=unclassified Pseudomonas TaxID=196821 RepID=UPI00069E050C|nr:MULTISPECIES: hypothetical protein [unclassified Pseudomonas]WPN48991.1 hypothetical protein QMK58_10080 [Pseudomonas sp. P8_241]